MLLQARQKTQRLQTVNPQRLEEIIVRRQLLAWNFELDGGHLQEFFQCCLFSRHSVSFRADTAVRLCSLRTSSMLLQPWESHKADTRSQSPASIHHKGCAL